MKSDNDDKVSDGEQDAKHEDAEAVIVKKKNKRKRLRKLTSWVRDYIVVKS